MTCCFDCFAHVRLDCYKRKKKKKEKKETLSLSTISFPFVFEIGENDTIDLTDQSHRSSRLSNESETHHLSFEQRSTSFQDDDDDDDMNDPHLDRAATRIQASYRGYKTRKELGTTSGQPSFGNEQHSSLMSSQILDEYENTRSKNSKCTSIVELE
jgi:hypothetical protein